MRDLRINLLIYIILGWLSIYCCASKYYIDREKNNELDYDVNALSVAEMDGLTRLCERVSNDKTGSRSKKKLYEYISHYVNFFLVSSNLKDKVPSDSQDIYEVKIYWKISGEDLLFLQSIAEAPEEFSSVELMLGLDSILARSLTFMEPLTQNFKSFFFGIINLLLDHQNEVLHQLLTDLNFWCVCVSLVIALYRRRIQKFGCYRTILFVFNNLIILDGFKNYWNTVKEKNDECMRKILKSYENERREKTFFETMSSWLPFASGPEVSSCEEVSLLDSMINSYTKIFLKISIGTIVEAMSFYIREMTKDSPWFLKVFYNIFSGISFFALLVLVAVIGVLYRLNGLKFSLFGAGLELKFGENQNHSERHAISDASSTLPLPPSSPKKLKEKRKVLESKGEETEKENEETAP